MSVAKHASQTMRQAETAPAAVADQRNAPAEIRLDGGLETSAYLRGEWDPWKVITC